MVNERIGRFEITSFIGRGGMAAVYHAYDPEQDRPVAIKVLGQEYQNDLGFRARFEREAETIARLSHPAIVRLCEFGQQEGKLFIVMEYMPNGSLADRIRQGPLSIFNTGSIIKRVGAALDYAHSQGIVHLDLKPSNILFDQDGDAYLADFGIALQSTIFTQDRIVLSGTPAYMSPEQARKEKEIDGRSDLYSLGITMYESLTGTLPFDKDTPIVTLIKRVQESPPSPREKNPELPSTLDPLFDRILSIDPAQRYSSGAAFAQAFYRACDLEYSLEEETKIDAAIVLAEQDLVDNLPASSPQAETLEASLLTTPKMEHTAVVDAVETGESRSILKDIEKRLGEEPVVLFILISLLGILCAAVVVSLIRAPTLQTLLRSEATTETRRASSARSGEIARLNPKAAAARMSQEANVMLVYSDAAVTTINLSPVPLILEGLVLSRTLDNNNQVVTVTVNLWEEIAEGSGDTLPAGDCYQILHQTNVLGDLSPNPILLPNCDSLQNWSVADEQDWIFWIPDETDEEFQVFQGDQIIHTCSLGDGFCKFYLPQP
jgi:serine/threonine protein kinase